MFKILKAFFFSHGKFQPIYFWATIILSLVISGVVIKYCEDEKLTDTLILGLMGFVGVLVGLYNVTKKKEGEK